MSPFSLSLFIIRIRSQVPEHGQPSWTETPISALVEHNRNSTDRSVAVNAYGQFVEPWQVVLPAPSVRSREAQMPRSNAPQRPDLLRTHPEMADTVRINKGNRSNA